MYKFLGLIVGSIGCFGAMQEGFYQGEGIWKHDEQEGYYKVVTKISDSEIQNKYTWDKTDVEFNIHLKKDSSNKFLIQDLLGNVIGKGYCMVIQCHYEITKGLELEETLTFYQNHLYRMGSKIENGKYFTWSEDQIKQD